MALPISIVFLTKNGFETRNEKGEVVSQWIVPVPFTPKQHHVDSQSSRLTIVKRNVMMRSKTENKVYHMPTKVCRQLEDKYDWNKHIIRHSYGFIWDDMFVYETTKKRTQILPAHQGYEYIGCVQTDWLIYTANSKIYIFHLPSKSMQNEIDCSLCIVVGRFLVYFDENTLWRWEPNDYLSFDGQFSAPYYCSPHLFDVGNHRFILAYDDIMLFDALRMTQLFTIPARCTFPTKFVETQPMVYLAICKGTLEKYDFPKRQVTKYFTGPIHQHYALPTGEHLFLGKSPKTGNTLKHGIIVHPETLQWLPFTMTGLGRMFMFAYVEKADRARLVKHIHEATPMVLDLCAIVVSYLV